MNIDPLNVTERGIMLRTLPVTICGTVYSRENINSMPASFPEPTGSATSNMAPTSSCFIECFNSIAATSILLNQDSVCVTIMISNNISISKPMLACKVDMMHSSHYIS